MKIKQIEEMHAGYLTDIIHALVNTQPIIKENIEKTHKRLEDYTSLRWDENSDIFNKIKYIFKINSNYYKLGHLYQELRENYKMVNDFSKDRANILNELEKDRISLVETIRREKARKGINPKDFKLLDMMGKERSKKDYIH